MTVNTAPIFCIQISFIGVERDTQMKKTTTLKFLFKRLTAELPSGDQARFWNIYVLKLALLH